MVTFKFLCFYFLCQLGAEIAIEASLDFNGDIYNDHNENNVEVGFHLYTKANPKVPQSLESNNLKSFQESNFNPLHQIKIVIHGYNQNYTRPQQSSQVILKGYQCNGGDFNVILIEYKSSYGNWGSDGIFFFGRDYHVVLSQKVAGIISKKIADFIEFIKKSYSEVTNKNIDLIGFGFGGQISGLVGSFVNGKLNSIAALDPASSEFYDKSDEWKLNKDDADYVEVIHTSELSGFRKSETLGTSDIFINYEGSTQLGCEKEYHLALTACNHHYAFKIFARSLCENEKEPLLAYECTKDDFYAKKCTDDPEKNKVIIGGNPLTPKTGRYFFKNSKVKQLTWRESMTKGRKNR